MHDILFTLLRTTLILTLCGGICFIVLRKIESQLPKLSRLLWIAVLLTGWCWVQPVVQVPCHLAGNPAANDFLAGTPLEIPIVPTAEYRLKEVPTLAGTPLPETLTEPRPEGRAESIRNLPIAALIFALYLTGMAITLLLAASGYLRILHRLKYTTFAEDALTEPWKGLLTEHGIDSRTIPMLLSKNLGPALILTPLGYRLVVPSELWSELSASGRQGILRHELAHFRRRDVWKSFFVRILTLPHWFNPVAHYAANRFDELAEQLCDREAFWGEQENISEFAKVLLLLHENAPTHFVARQSIFGHNLARRIASLQNNPQSERKFTMRKTLLVLGAAAILCAALFRVEFVAQERTGVSPPVSSDQPAQNRGANAAPLVENPALATHHWSSVIEAETQKPLAGVKATLYFAKPGGREVDSRITYTDEQGRILFPLPSELNADEEAGTIILVEKESYVSENDGRQAKWAEIFLNEERLVCDVFPLQKAESITGQLVDEQGKPLANVLVAVFREKVKPFGREELMRTESLELKSDAVGRFCIDAAKNEKIVFWAIPDNLAPQYVFPDQKRGDLGNITVEKGFEATVTVLDKDGKPVQDVWIDLRREGEGYRMATMTPYARSALTDKEGNARFRPVAEGNYDIRVVERPSERCYSPWSALSNVTWRANSASLLKPVKGTYLSTPTKLSTTSPTITIQAQSIVNVDVQFSDKTVDSYREINTNIVGKTDDAWFFSRPSSDSPSPYQGDGLFVFKVPVGLEKAFVNIHSDTDTAYRVKIGGEENWIEAEDGYRFSLGTIDKPMRIDVTAYKSPKITVNVIDEAGQPVKEYYAWIEYVSKGTPAKIKVAGDKIRIDITQERWHEIDWEWATSEMSLGGILDVSFKYRNFGNEETKINAAGILPDEEMRLHIVGRGFALSEQLIPKMAEGEERELTIVMKK